MNGNINTRLLPYGGLHRHLRLSSRLPHDAMPAAVGWTRKMVRVPLLLVSLLVFGLIHPLAAQTELVGIGTVSAVEKIQGEFQFVEGPAKAPDGTLYFSDIPANSIFKLGSDGNIALFLSPSLHANGLMYGGDHRLLACQMDGQLAAIDLTTKAVSALANEYAGKRFNACNDLVIDREGGIYFTDPRFRAPDPWPQGKEAFYYRAANGQVTRLGDDLPAPNGIALAPDEKTLYVIPSMQAEMMAYPVISPGKIGAGRVFCKLQQTAGQANDGGDGLAVDSQGNLYITSALGIQVFQPNGTAVGTIAVPEQPANCAFGGPDNRTLFITARTGLYKCTMPVAGHLQRTE